MMHLNKLVEQLVLVRSVTLADHERGLLTRQGRVVAWLEPGRHWLVRRDTDAERIDLDEAVADLTPEIRAVIPAGAATELFVPHEHVALVTVDGRPTKCLLPGRYLLWQLRAEVKATLVSTAAVIANESVPEAFRALVPPSHLTTVTIGAHEQGLLHVDGVFQRSLPSGAWAVWCAHRTVSIERVDLREREVQIVGQEVMTADKVTVRINLVVKFKVVDPEKAAREVVALETALYSEAQLSARRWVAGATVDQLLERRSDARTTMRAEVQARAEAWGATVLELDLKDVVLPGEMKTILNQVIEAEKRAAANVILRREETAATRSLMNTAKLLEQNPMLLRLKELEAYKEIAQSIDSMTVIAGPAELAAKLALPR